MIVGIAAIVVSVMTMFVYIFQAGIMMDQQHMSVWPYVEWSETYINSEDQEFYIEVFNKGVGPAIVKDVKLTLDGKKYDNYPDVLQELLGGKEILDSLWRLYSPVNHRVLAPGEQLKVFYVKNWKGARIPEIDIKRLTFSICYCNIYDDCWTTRGLVVEESECE